MMKRIHSNENIFKQWKECILQIMKRTHSDEDIFPMMMTLFKWQKEPILMKMSLIGADEQYLKTKTFWIYFKAF